MIAIPSVCPLRPSLSATVLLGFSYLARGLSLHGFSSKAQPLLLTLDERYLLTAAPPDLECCVAPLSLSIESLKTLFLVSLEAEPGLCPRATLLFPGCSSFVSASSPLPDGQLFKSALRNSGKVLEAGVCSLQTRNGRQKSHAQEPHRVLLGFLIDPPSLPDHLICPCSWLSKDLITL